MATSMESVGNEIKTRLQTIAALKHVWAPNQLPLSVNEFPAALILPAATEYHNDFSGDMTNTFRVVILLSNQDNPSALNKLLDFIDTTGANSVLAAVEASTTNVLQVTRNNGAGAINWGGKQYLSTEFEVVCKD